MAVHPEAVATLDVAAPSSSDITADVCCLTTWAPDISASSKSFDRINPALDPQTMMIVSLNRNLIASLKRGLISAAEQPGCRSIGK